MESELASQRIKALAEFTEGTMISAFRDEYVWSSRNEFKQQWALERP